VDGVFDAPKVGRVCAGKRLRKPSLKFDNLIRGTAWIDQVSITVETGEFPALSGGDRGSVM
jgi:hypothetical protein